MLPMQLQLKRSFKTAAFFSITFNFKAVFTYFFWLHKIGSLIGIGKIFPENLLQILCCQQIRDIKQLLITNKNANIILGTEREAKCVNYTNAARGVGGKNTGCFSFQNANIPPRSIFMYSQTRWTSLCCWSYKSCRLKG